MTETLFTATRKDFRVDTYRGTGPGGQHRNKTDSCVRITHIATGLVASACDSRKQAQNKKTAFEKLAKLILAHVKEQYQTKRHRSTVTVRTYHGADNRVKDHLSGLEQPYLEVLNDPAKMIESRAEAARGSD
jgi:protein subunit release factor A